MMIIDDRHNIRTIIKPGLIEIDSRCYAPDFFKVNCTHMKIVDLLPPA